MDLNKVKKDVLIKMFNAIKKDTEGMEKTIETLKKEKDTLNKRLIDCKSKLRTATIEAEENDILLTETRNENIKLVEELNNNITTLNEDFERLHKKALRLGILALISTAIAIASTICCWL